MYGSGDYQASADGLRQTVIMNNCEALINTYKNPLVPTSDVILRFYVSVFNQGDEGKSWYIILKGSVNVVIYGKVS